MTLDLRALTPDPSGGNPERVAAITSVVGALEDTSPWVLLPVRIETRFVEVEVPALDARTSLSDLAERLAEAVEKLDWFIVTDLKTELPDTSQEDRRKFKDDIENPLMDDAARRLDEVITVLEAADSLMRDPLDGDEAVRDAVSRAATALRARLPLVAGAIGQVRSDFQRDRLGTVLDRVTGLAGTTLAAVEGRQLPATRLRETLDIPRRAPVGGPAAILTHTRLAAGAATYETLVKRVRTLGGDPFDVNELAAAATTIPLLPGDYKRTLAAEVEAARRRVPSADLDALAAAVAAIRSDVRELDDAVPAPDLNVVLPAGTKRVSRLLVRFYPDDIAVDTHEEALTEAERDAGVAFWQATAAAGADELAQRAAWRALVTGRGSRRAAWVARRTEPPARRPTAGVAAGERILAALTTFERRLDEVASAPPGARFEALVRAAEGCVKPLSTERDIPQWAIDRAQARYAVIRSACVRLDAESRRPGVVPDEATREGRTDLRRAIRKIDLRINRLDVEAPPRPYIPPLGALKDGAWTRAARSNVLPERFLVVGVAGGRVTHVVAGQPVPWSLKLSIDPNPSDPAAEEFRLTEDGELVVGASIRWMVDFQEAVAKGMAVTIDLTPAERNAGFDALYVLGVTAHGPATGATLLERQLDNHRYGETGMAIVPIGTPTNNTEGAAAGYRSTDDPEQSFDLERGPARFDPAQAVDAGASDGARAARALGVDATRLNRLEGAGGRDAAEAQAINAALYPATLGASLEEHFGPLISRDARDRVRAFVLAHVAGRGLLPALRIGAQPYGLLPVTAYSQFVGQPEESAVPTQADRDRQIAFDRRMGAVLRRMADDWAALREQEVPYATEPGVSDPRAHFLRLLGLEPVSTSASYRFAVNVAGRRGAASRDPELSFGLPPQGPGSGGSSQRFGPFALLERFTEPLRDAFGVPAGAPVLTDGQVSDAFADVYARIQDSRAYGLRQLKRAHSLGDKLVRSAQHDPAVYLTTLATATPNALAQQTTAGTGPRTLLGLLARHSLLLEWREAALRILIAEGLLTEEGRIEAGASSHFVVSTLTERATLTRWSYLLAPLNELNGLQGITFSGRPLFVHVGGGAMTGFLAGSHATFAGGRHTPLVQAAQRHAAAIAALGSIPPERLEPLLMEHLDLAGHRLDAWLTGLAHRRLASLRAARPRGANIGAYGWVEDLRADSGQLLATNVPPSLDGDPSRPIHQDPESQGFIHAPSLNHAVTAAILRSGFLSQGGEATVDNRMAVNLSSRRTRLGLGLIDGVRAGNQLGALLGYRLERFLHEYHATAGVTLDDVIGPLRKAYPSVADVDRTLNEQAAARQVCDGLAIVDAVNRWIAANAASRAVGRTVYEVLSEPAHLGSAYPWGLNPQAIPPRTQPARLDGVLRAIDHVADALDAAGDLVVAEAVHQLALGNHARAAAALSALSEGKAPPRPEVADTPRTGTPVTQRLLLAVPPAGAAAPAGWEAVPPTPRAAAEPALNAWAAGLLGPPGLIRLRVVRADDGSEAGSVSIADLGLHALDVVAILGPGLATGFGELAARAIDAFRPSDLHDELPPAPLQVDLARSAAWDDDVRAIAEVAPLIEALSGVIGVARPATAEDLVTPEDAPGGGDGLDLAELRARVLAARDALATTWLDLARLLADDPALTPEAAAAVSSGDFLAAHPPFAPPSWSAREVWRAALLRAAAFGVNAALPPTAFETRVAVRSALRAAAEAAFSASAERLANADRALVQASSARSLDDAAKALFGDEFTACPRLQPRNEPELAASLADRLASGTVVDEWLQGAAQVREPARALSDLIVLAEAHGTAVAPGQVAQLPRVPGEAWVGGVQPAGASAAGRLSLVVFGAEALAARGVALLLDHWTEVIPSREELTGVAVHYDQPDSTAPQAVLIAVPPVRRGRWQLGDLVQTLHDTLELAKSRSVELEHLQKTMYGQLLPAITGELVPEAAGPQPVAGNRVVLDFGAAR